MEEQEILVEPDIPLLGDQTGPLTRIEIQVPYNESFSSISQRRSKVDGHNLFQDFKQRDSGILFYELSQQEESDADTILINTSPMFIANSLTRLEAYQYMFDRGLPTKPLKPSRAWQQSNLIRQDRDDKVVISRIRKHLLYKSFNKYKEDDWAYTEKKWWHQSALKILHKIAESVLTWCLEDHIEYCEANNIAIERDDDDMKICMKAFNHLQEECERFRKENYSYEVKELELYDPLRAAANITTEWMINDYFNFFIQHHLPTWGSEKVLIERYYAWKWELANGHPRPHDDLSKFTAPEDSDWASCVFLLHPDIASVEALKSAIYTAETFPANCDFELRKLNEVIPLQNHKMLGVYASGGDSHDLPIMPDVLELEVIVHPTQASNHQRKRRRSESAESPVFKKRQINQKRNRSARSSLYESLIGSIPTPQAPTIAELLTNIGASSIIFARSVLPGKELLARHPYDSGNEPPKLPASVLLKQVTQAEELLEKINGDEEDRERELAKFESEEKERNEWAKGHMVRIKKGVRKEYSGTGNKRQKLVDNVVGEVGPNPFPYLVLLLQSNLKGL
jgi:hypothetical protein